MPVLTSLTINYFFGSPDKDAVSFLNPAALSERCHDVIEDADKRSKAVKLSDELQRLSSQYQKAVITTLEAYIDESVKWDSSAEGLIEIAEPLDESRRKALQDIIRVRRAMRELLTTEQWHQVFS